MSFESDYDFIIVGAGVAGPSLAVGLVREGWKVLVIERDMSEPDRIVGELLQPGGLEALRGLDLEKAVENIDSVPIKGYSVIYKGQPVDVPYPSGYTGRGFHHGRFIMKLRKLAQEKGVEFMEGTVKDVIRMKGDSQVFGVIAVDKKTGKEMEILAPITVIADGISSKFRKEFTTEKPKIYSHFVGLILKDIQNDLPAPQHGHVIIGPDHQPILIYQVDSNETRILCDVQGPLPSIVNGDMKTWLETEVRPRLPKAIQNSFDDAVETKRYRVMPAQKLSATMNKTRGLIMVGDAMNMRHPLTGGGMTVALKDAKLLSSLFKKSEVPSIRDHFAVRTALKKYYTQRRHEGVAVINILALALYSLFAANSSDIQILQRGCFGYFQRGGECVNGPVSLLAGVQQRVSMLFYHFFSVAFYSIYLNFKDKGLAGFPIAFLQIFTVFYQAVVIFVPLMWRELRWW